MDCHFPEFQQTPALMLQEVKVEVEETNGHLPESPESLAVVVQEEILDHVFPGSPGKLEVEKLKHDLPKSPETSEVILQEVKLEIGDKDCDSLESLVETSEVILQDVKLEIGDKDCDSPESLVETSEVLLQDVKLEIKDMDCDSLKSLESSAVNLQTRKLEMGEMNCEFSGSFKASAAVILQAVKQEVGDMDCDSPTSPETSELILQAREQKPGQLKASEVSSGRDCTKVSEVSSGKDCTKVSGRECTKASLVHHALLPGYSTLVHTLKAAGHSSSTPVDPAPGRTVGDEAGRQQILTADRRRLVSPQDHHTSAAATRGKVISRKGADSTGSFLLPEKSQEKLPDHQSHTCHRLSPEHGRRVSARWRRPTLKGCDYVTDFVSGSGRVKRGSSVKATDCGASDGRSHRQRKQKKAKLQASCSSHSDFSDTSATSSTSATSHTRSRSRPSRSLDFSAKERSSRNEGLGSPSRKLKGQAASKDQHHADADKRKRHVYGTRSLCAECGKTFFNASALRIHSTVHTGKKPHQCPLCDTVFSQKGDVTVHMRRRHTSERPYPCPQADCPKRFHSTSELARHRLMHAKAESISTGKAWPWTCTVCGLRCQNCFALTEHKELHSGRDVLPCDICHISFKRQRDLQRHKKEQHNPQGDDHTPGPGNYQCEHCKACYTWHNCLKRHIKVKHSGGQHRFKCPQCPARFPYPSSLKVHSRLHSGERPYVCPPPCGQSFTSNTALSRHQRTQHCPQQTSDATPPSTDTRCNTTLNRH